MLFFVKNKIVLTVEILLNSGELLITENKKKFPRVNIKFIHFKISLLCSNL